MNLINTIWKKWRGDFLLQKVVRNSGYLLGSNVFSIIQSIFTGRLLGIMGFGIIGTITTFASTLNRLFSFRMNELVVKYYGQYKENGEPQKAAAVVKAALLAEGSSAMLSFLICVLFARFAAAELADDIALAPFFILYGTIILANVFTETATGVLQVNNRFRDQAFLHLASSIVTAVVIVWAYIIKGGLQEVIIAYLLGKFIIGIGTAVIGFVELRKSLGEGWWKVSFELLPPLKELVGFAVSTNISSTIILLVRDNEVLWVAYFLSPLEAGYVKTALAIINLVLLPITPFISTTYPEINRTVAQRQWTKLKDLLRSVTFISAAWTGFTSIALVLFGRWFLLFYGPEFQPAYIPMLLLLIGLGFANILFWNRPLLLSLGLPLVPYKISLWLGLAKIGLAFLLVPKFGLNAEALLLSLFFVISISWIVFIGIKEIRKQESIRQASAA